MWREGGREGGGQNLLYEIQESVAVGQDASRGKFGWSEGDVLEIVFLPSISEWPRPLLKR